MLSSNNLNSNEYSIPPEPVPPKRQRTNSNHEEFTRSSNLLPNRMCSSQTNLFSEEKTLKELHNSPPPAPENAQNCNQTVAVTSEFSVQNNYDSKCNTYRLNSVTSTSIITSVSSQSSLTTVASNLGAKVCSTESITYKKLNENLTTDNISQNSKFSLEKSLDIINETNDNSFTELQAIEKTEETIVQNNEEESNKEELEDSTEAEGYNPVKKSDKNVGDIFENVEEDQLFQSTSNISQNDADNIKSTPIIEKESQKSIEMNKNKDDIVDFSNYNEDSVAPTADPECSTLQSNTEEENLKNKNFENDTKLEIKNEDLVAPELQGDQEKVENQNHDEKSRDISESFQDAEKFEDVDLVEAIEVKEEISIIENEDIINEIVPQFKRKGRKPKNTKVETLEFDQTVETKKTEIKKKKSIVSKSAVGRKRKKPVVDNPNSGWSGDEDQEDLDFILGSKKKLVI